MIALICMILLPPFWLAFLLLRLVMPRFFLFTVPPRPFRPALWHLMILIALIGGDYVLMTPDLRRGLPIRGVPMVVGDIFYLPLVFFAGCFWRLSIHRWMAVAFAIGVPICLTTAFLNRVVFR